MKLLLGLDLGTTALKIALFDSKGSLLAVSTQEYDLITPEVNFVEEDVEVYWKSFMNGLSDIKTQYDISEDDSIALAMSAQGETLIPVDKNGKALRNAIVWMDNRAEKEAAAMVAKFGNDTCYKVTGQVSFEPCWPAAKILWIKNNEPEIFSKTDKFLLIEDYMIYRLTGELASEGSLLCSTTYWDITKKIYWKEMLNFIGITEKQLPPIRESAEVVGKVKPEITEELGLCKDVTVCTGALDQACGAMGVGNIHEGMFSEAIGSAVAMCSPVSRPTFDPNAQMPLHYFAIPDMYMMHTFTTGGMALRWYRDKFCSDEMALESLGVADAYDLINKEVEKIPAGSEGLSMLPHLQGSLAPDVNAKAKGVYFGFTLKHTKAHFARALMESLGYILQRNLEALKNMGIEVKEIRALGGGAKSPVWSQIQADITGKKIMTVKSKEAACLGAAVLAGAATGLFDSIDSAVDNMVEVKDVYVPNTANREVYNKGYIMYKKLFNNLKECFEETL